MIRIGTGYDVHKLVSHRKLILGGVAIDFEKGLLGHSDADVLIHAIIDALLGAAAMGDIGRLFPDTDEKFKNVSSLKLLGEVNTLITNSGYEINNIDSIIIAQNPKLSQYIDKMRENISHILGLDVNCVSVKATTEEGLGFTGHGLGIAAHAVCLIVQK